MEHENDWMDGVASGAPEPLSRGGLERRSAMLEMLKGEVTRRKVRRTLLRRGLAAACLAAGVLLIAEQYAPRDVEQPGGLADAPLLPAPRAVEEPVPLEARLTSIRLEVVKSEADIAERWRVRGEPRHVVVLTGDDELLRELDGADRPSGIIRLPEGIILTADVTRPPTLPERGVEDGFKG